MRRLMSALQVDISGSAVPRAAVAYACAGLIGMQLAGIQIAGFGPAEAKAPGVSHCYRGVCHKVRTIEQTRRLVGQAFVVETSYYDRSGIDRFNRGIFTSNGERFDPNDSGRVASADLPDGTELLLRNPINGRVSHVRVNDFGPFRGNRRLDVTRRVAEDLDFHHKGVVRLDVIVIAAPQDDDLSYRRNRERRPTTGHLGVVFEAEMPALVVDLVTAAERAGEARVAWASIDVSDEAGDQIAADAWQAIGIGPASELTAIALAPAQPVASEAEAGGDARRAASEPALGVQQPDDEPAAARARVSVDMTTAPDAVPAPDATDTTGAANATHAAPALTIASKAIETPVAAAATVKTPPPKSRLADEVSFVPTDATASSFVLSLAGTSWLGLGLGLPLLITIFAMLSSMLAFVLARRWRDVPFAELALAPASKPGTAAGSGAQAVAAETTRSRVAPSRMAGVAVHQAGAAQQLELARPQSSLVAAGMTIEGRLRTSGRLEIGGHVKGLIEADEVVVLPGGSVAGEIVARIADIAGTAEGTVRCAVLTVRREARLEGTVVASALAVELGGTLNADVSRPPRG